MSNPERRHKSPQQLIFEWGPPGGVIVILFGMVLYLMNLLQYNHEQLVEVQKDSSEAIRRLAVAVESLKE